MVSATDSSSLRSWDETPPPYPPPEGEGNDQKGGFSELLSGAVHAIRVEDAACVPLVEHAVRNGRGTKIAARAGRDEGEASIDRIDDHGFYALANDGQTRVAAHGGKQNADEAVLPDGCRQVARVVGAQGALVRDAGDGGGATGDIE